MTTNNPGTVNQQPLYGCTSCYEEYSWPASDLRVYDGECWCGECWDERRWDFPDHPCWNDLEPYTPAPQAERDSLVEALERLVGDVERGNHIEFGGTPWLKEKLAEIDYARAALAAHRIKENENGNG